MVSLLIGFFLSGCKTKPQLHSEFVGESDDKIEVIVVNGTPREMGYELGKHLEDKAQETLQNYMNTAYKEDSNLINPESLLQVWKSNESFMDNRFLEEMQGFAEGSGIELEELQRAHAIPLIAPYACSGVNVWGKASTTGELFHIRNLDYSMDAGLQDFPIVVIYKPTDGIAHANITFSGMLSSHTGINEYSIVLGEKGESPSREIPYDLQGKHFTVLFRQILYDAKSLSDVESIIENTPLIKRYYLFVGDGKKKDNAGLKYLVSTPDSIQLHKWTDMDSTDIFVPKVYDDVTYYTMKNEKASEYINKNYGKIGYQEMIDFSKLVAAKSNLMNVVYNATSKEIWVANATNKERAAERNYVHVDLKKHFE